MKKILFNDKFGLTQAVLDGRKTQTRRIIKFSPIDAKYVKEEGWSIGGYVASEIINRYSRYKVGEVVAVAQSYSDFMEADKVLYRTVKEVDGYRRELASEQKGWNNKLFVCADLMPHRIRITDVRVERLNDISESDCIAEGIREVEVSNNWGNSAAHTEYRVTYQDKYSREKLLIGRTPREAYAALIDRISGKGTWNSNPYIFAYTFELVK